MMIYADNAATTKMSRAAIEAMTACLEEEYGNPSSLYARGQRAKEILEQVEGPIDGFCSGIGTALKRWWCWNAKVGRVCNGCKSC